MLCLGPCNGAGLSHTISNHATFLYHNGTGTTGCPKKIGLLSSFEFLSLGGVFLGVKSNSKNSGTKKI